MAMTKDAVRNILGRFKKARILVVGDLILDEFIWGKADRISPEAPVPVVWAQSRSTMPGGASNVANNVASLGGRVSLCGVVGDDKTGQVLVDELRQKGVDCDGVIGDPLRPTTVKTRIIAAHQQVVRVDWEETRSLSADKISLLMKTLKRRIPDVDAVIIEDYGKGVVTPLILKNIIALARLHKKIVTVDPKIEHFSLYKGVTAMTPNEKEASAGSKVRITDESDVDRAGWVLMKKLGCQGVLITQGEKGMKLFKGGRVIHIPTVAQEVFDVSGAGDTVISVFTLALASGMNMVDAAKISNVAAGIVVGKIGVAVVTPQELLDTWDRLGGRLA
jgi:rfaE bifunctional protein kinase chain/domain